MCTGCKWQDDSVDHCKVSDSYKRGWNDCIQYLLEHLDDFQNELEGGQYDYFPYDDISHKLIELSDRDDKSEENSLKLGG